MFQLIKLFFNRKARLALTVPEFCESNKDLLILVCDPKEDTITVAYKHKFVHGRIKSADGQSRQVIRNVLKESKFHTSVDDFIVSVAETLGVNMKSGNDLYKFIDGALFNISLAVSGKKKPELPKQAAAPPVKEEAMAGAVKSPYQ